MKLPEQQDMPGRGPIMTEKWMKLKGWQKWKDRGMTAFSYILRDWLTEELCLNIYDVCNHYRILSTYG
jgi:hypothetical protein